MKLQKIFAIFQAIGRNNLPQKKLPQTFLMQKFSLE